MRGRNLLGLAALVALLFGVAIAGQTNIGKMSQQTLSDADSLGAAADTSTAVAIGKKNTAAWVHVVCDSVAIYTVQVSPDEGTTWFSIDVDTTAASTFESTADLGTKYNGWRLRVIYDGLWSTGKKNGYAWFAQTE